MSQCGINAGTNFAPWLLPSAWKARVGSSTKSSMESGQPAKKVIGVCRRTWGSRRPARACPMSPSPRSTCLRQKLPACSPGLSTSSPPARSDLPLIRERIHLEVDRRILTPNLARDFYWMGFPERPGAPVRAPNNWNPWINSNWLASALLLERDAGRRRASVHKIVRSLDRFLDGYQEDGGCDEGPSYWSRAEDHCSIASSSFIQLPAAHSAFTEFR